MSPAQQNQQNDICAPVHMKIGPFTTYWAHKEDSDQTGRMPRLIWVFAGHT